MPKKSYFIAKKSPYTTKKMAEAKITNRMENGENLQGFRLFEAVKIYKPVIKFVEEK